MDSVAPIPPRLRPLLDPASPVQELERLLTGAGHQSYLVGGSVRDAFLDGTIAWRDLAILLAWAVIGTTATARTFSWE